LFNGEFIPAPVKAELRAKSEGVNKREFSISTNTRKDNQNYRQFTK